MRKSEVLLDAIGEIRDEMIEDTHATGCVRRFTGKRAFVLAAALVMCFALALTGMAAADVGVVYDALYRISPEIAQRLKPVRMSCESSGIRMEVLSANVQGNTAEVYVSLQDLAGERLDASVDLFDSYDIRGAFDYEAWCRQVSYDDLSGTATFLIEIESREPIKSENVTFSVGCLLAGKREFEGRLDVDLSDVPQAAETMTGLDEIARGYSADMGYLVPAEALMPEDMFATIEGATVTGIAYVGDMLHMQVRYDDIHATDNHGYLWLVDAQGRERFCDAEISFWGENGDSYDELVFDIAPEELAQCELWGRFVSSSGKIDGNWEVTFPVTAAK